MPKIIAFIVFFSILHFSYSQVSFQSLSFDAALQQASRSDKFVMVQIDSKDCANCNEVADKGFADKNLGEKLKKDFIAIRPAVNDADWQHLTDEYEGSLGVLFFSGSGILLHKYNGSSTSPKRYIDAAEEAIKKQVEIANIETLTQAFYQNRQNIFVLQSLLQKRRELVLSTDSLLDFYVGMLPADSLKSLLQLQYIAKFAPILNSNADSMLRKDMDLFNQAWYRMDLKTRVNINNRIIYKTRTKAIKEKNLALAFRVANFAVETNNNLKEKSRLHQYNMMEFYFGIKDSMNYLRYAASYYDRYPMRMNRDSVFKKDSLNRNKLLADTKGDTIREGNQIKVVKSISYRPAAQFYARELNNAAWRFYKMTTDSIYLKKALSWAKKANEFFESPEVMDTYARLLYKTGNKAEAIQWQTKAVSVQKKRGFNSKALEEVLVNMQHGKEIASN